MSENAAPEDHSDNLKRALAEERARRKEAADQAAALQARLAEIEAAQAAAEQKAAEEQGRFKELYETERQQREAAAAKLEELTKREQERAARLDTLNKERLSKLPDELKPLVPSGLSPEVTADHLTRLEALAVARPAGGKRPGGKPGDEEIPEGVVAEAKRLNRSPERHWAYVKRQRAKREKARH